MSTKGDKSVYSSHLSVITLIVIILICIHGSGAVVDALHTSSGHGTGVISGHTNVGLGDTRCKPGFFAEEIDPNIYILQSPDVKRTSAGLYYRCYPCSQCGRGQVTLVTCAPTQNTRCGGCKETGYVYNPDTFSCVPDSDQINKKESAAAPFTEQIFKDNTYGKYLVVTGGGNDSKSPTKDFVYNSVIIVMGGCILCLAICLVDMKYKTLSKKNNAEHVSCEQQRCEQKDLLENGMIA